ncbi:MAG TPA: rod shape-determining protein MreD [Gammaproteobacteria bacterium]|nr:rod shape-determining protein MreD [Gammaproteobacteria bacterium]HIK70577.1 rod shape-determining protein MreD [Pseudomonadales bacterium]
MEPPSMASEASSKGSWVILSSLFMALILTILPLPEGVPMEMGYLRPDWLALVIVYWTLALPDRVGLLTAFFVGLLADVISGSLLGLHAMGLVMVASFALAAYQRIRMLAVWQQATIVFLILTLLQIVSVLITVQLSGRAFSWLTFLIPLVSALVWPWIFLGLRALRRRFIN